MELFHENMINYWLKEGTIFKYNWLEFWNEFVNFHNEEDGEKFRKEMVFKILPNIKTFTLNDEQKKCLTTLRYDIFLDENEEGFTPKVAETDAAKIKIILEHLISKVGFLGYELFKILELLKIIYSRYLYWPRSSTATLKVFFPLSFSENSFSINIYIYLKPRLLPC